MKLYRFVKFCERNFFQKGNRLAQLILFFWISMFFCFLIFFAPCFCCHPGLASPKRSLWRSWDPGSLCFLLFFFWLFFICSNFCSIRFRFSHDRFFFELFSFLGGLIFEFFFL